MRNDNNGKKPDEVQTLNGWPAEQWSVVQELLRKHPLQIEEPVHHLVLQSFGPWSRVELRREGTRHNFPTPHEGFLLLTIPYYVPDEKADEIIRFNGSILIDRTRGEVTARVDSEAMGFLTFNLMNEVVLELRSVAEARNKYAEQAAEYMTEGEASYTRALNFDLPQRPADPDVSVITDKMLREISMRGRTDLFTGDHRTDDPSSRQ